MNSEFLKKIKKFEGKTLDYITLEKLPDSTEKQHLLEIRDMLLAEKFNAAEFYLFEIPMEGIYCINEIGDKKDFQVSLVDGVLRPNYLTHKVKMVDGQMVNNFNCDTISEAIQFMNIYWTESEKRRK